MFSRLFAIVLLIISCGVDFPALADDLAHVFVATNPPRPMPLLSFEDEKGRSLSLKDFRGRYVLLNLWATWCSPCAHEMPSLDVLQKKISPKDLAVLALTENHDGLAAAQSFYSRHALQTLPIYVDASGQVPSLVHARGMPTTILIDPKGFEVGRVEGESDWAASTALTFLQEKIRR